MAFTDVINRLDEFPCAFNISRESRRATRNKLISIEEKLKTELVTDDDTEEERIRKNNFLSFVLFSLGEKDKALEINDRVIRQTRSQNISSMASRVFIIWRTDEVEARKWLCNLESMKQRQDFAKLKTEALAEQAYSYSRLGGGRNLPEAIKLYEKATKEYPDKYMWKLGLGLAYRRFAHDNIFSSNPSFLPIEDVVRNAAENLFDVAENGDHHYRGLAYAHLVYLRQRNRSEHTIFKNKSIHELCDLAMEYGSGNASVLELCGRAYIHIDIDKAISMLESSNNIRETSTTMHSLGTCYERRAKLISQGKYGVAGRGRGRGWGRGRGRGGYQNQHQPSQSPIDEKTVSEKALEYYRKAIHISHGTNLPPVVCYGKILLRLGRIKEALQQFNSVINTKERGLSMMTLIDAYEQAGLCLLQISKTAENREECQEAGKEKLLKALSLAADLASSVPAIDHYSKAMWQAFRALETSFMQEDQSVRREKKMIPLLQMVRDHGKILSVMKNIVRQSEEELDDTDNIRITMDSYMQLGQYENAFAFHNMVSTRPRLVGSDAWRDERMLDFRVKTLLSVAYHRLNRCEGLPPEIQVNNDDAVHVFTQIFSLIYGQCAGNQDEDSVADMNDVLLVYDESQRQEGCPDPVEEAAKCLKKVMIEKFGLEANLNLQACTEYMNVPLELLLQEMMRHQVVVLMIGNESCTEFDELVKRVPYLEADPPTCPESPSASSTPTPTPPAKPPTVVVINFRGTSSDVPRMLKPYRCLGARELSSLYDGPDRSMDVETVMRLFSFLVGKTWATPARR